MSVEFLDLRAAASEIEPDLRAALQRVAESGHYVLGDEVAAFEQEFARYCRVEHCIGVGNGLDALQLVLRAWGIGGGDEVIVPAYTAVATWIAVSLTGATPVGADVDPSTYSIDPVDAETRITSRTRAIIPVHIFGQPAPMDTIRELSERHGLLVLEDAAQSHGARYRDKPTGSVGHAGAFSFYPTKNLGALGDGGAVVTDDDALADIVRALRTYGWRSRGDSELTGLNSRLDELQAAVLRVKLSRLDEWNARRRELALRYLKELEDCEGLELPGVPDWADPVWHLFVIGHEQRDRLRDRLRESGVSTLVHYFPLPHLTQLYRREGWKEGSLPRAERLAERAISLPLHPHLGGPACDQVVRLLHESLPRAATATTG